MAEDYMVEDSMVADGMAEDCVAEGCMMSNWAPYRRKLHPESTEL